MTAALGRTLILVALALGAGGAVLGFVAGRLRSAAALRWTRGIALAYAAALAAATAAMEYALITHDFSVSYVAHVGSRSTPLYITIISLWSSLEGSILFWGLIIGMFTAAFTWLTRNRDVEFVPYALGTILFVGTFFAFLIAGPANPFKDTPLPIPLDGPGPNPLLQNHPLMIVHPPMLYLGYVGMTIPFGMGMAALFRGRAGTSWLASTRRWMLVPWGFLTAGIVLGGWWAYEVLGWGGYWAWDPVENASLLPWLTATAFLHAGMLQERRGLLKGWTLVLLLATFSLTILGTFMTRSGVFNSVHSFTQSDIGPTLLAFLAIVLIGSVALLATRVHLLERGQAIRSAVSREAAFLLNNLLFVIFTFTVLVGTTFPLFAEAIRGVKVSVGMPFFNQFALPVGIAIVFMMGVGPALPWGRPRAKDVKAVVLVPLTIAALVTAMAVVLGVRALWPAIAIAVASFAAAVAVRDMVIPVRAQRRSSGLPWGRAALAAFARGKRRYGGQIVHIGVTIAVVAIALSGSYQQATERVLKRGENLAIGDYTVKFTGAHTVNEPNRQRTIATFAVARDGRDLGVLEPAMNQYPNQMSPVGSPAVRSGPAEDLYLSLMQVDPDGAFAGLRAYVNPAVFWLWIALGVMLTGCGVAVWPSGLSRRRTARAPSPAASSVPSTPPAPDTGAGA